jgi:hypothetical protein
LGQKVKPLDNTSFSVSDNTLVDRFTTILSPEQVLYSLNSFLLKIQDIIFEVSGTALTIGTFVTGSGISTIKGSAFIGSTIGM